MQLGSLPLLLVLVGLVLARAAGAQQADAEASPPDTARTGAYVGLAGGVSFLTRAEDELEDATGIPFDVDPSGTLHARVGYRLHPHFAAEVHFEWLSEFDIEVPGLGRRVATLDGWALGADAKGYVLTGRVQPFLLVGLGALHAELEDDLGLGVSVEETGFAARFGGGLDVYATDHVVLGLDLSYLLPTGDVEELDTVSLGFGVQYRF